MSQFQEWETIDGLIRIASWFDIKLTKRDARQFQQRYGVLLTAGSLHADRPNRGDPGCWACGSFPLVLKPLLLPYSSGPSQIRPKAKPDRAYYCLDDYGGKVTTLGMHSLETSAYSGNEMSPGQETAYRRWEDRGLTGEP